jgi:hypothetical protein
MCGFFNGGENEPTATGTCLGYVDGVVSGLQLATNAARAKPLFCMPKGVTVGEGIRVVMKYLNDHPPDLHQSAPLLILNAMLAAYPCR